MHHFQWNVVGQIPIFMSELLQELVEQHPLWTSTQQFLLDDHVHRYRAISTLVTMPRCRDVTTPNMFASNRLGIANYPRRLCPSDRLRG